MSNGHPFFAHVLATELVDHPHPTLASRIQDIPEADCNQIGLLACTCCTRRSLHKILLCNRTALVDLISEPVCRPNNAQPIT